MHALFSWVLVTFKGPFHFFLTLLLLLLLLFSCHIFASNSILSLFLPPWVCLFRLCCAFYFSLASSFITSQYTPYQPYQLPDLSALPHCSTLFIFDLTTQFFVVILHTDIFVGNLHDKLWRHYVWLGFDNVSACYRDLFCERGLCACFRVPWGNGEVIQRKILGRKSLALVLGDQDTCNPELEKNRLDYPVMLYRRAPRAALL